MERGVSVQRPYRAVVTAKHASVAVTTALCKGRASEPHVPLQASRPSITRGAKAVFQLPLEKQGTK